MAVAAENRAPVKVPEFSKDQDLKAYRDMLLIRRFEEKAGQMYGMGLIGGFCHLYIGQEAVVVGMQMALKEGDQVITGYRDHGHMLACEMDPKGVMAELTGRKNGYSRGKGGSTAIGQLAAPVASHADQAMVYLLATLIAALGGRGPGLTAAVLCAAAFDFFFVEPLYTFAVADRSFVITFAVMLAIGLAIGSLVNRLRVVEAEARDREVSAKAEQLRSTLLSSVSHDLRTPLAVITGMASSLRDGARGTCAAGA